MTAAINVKVFHQPGFAGMHRGYRAGDPLLLVFETTIPGSASDDLVAAAESLFGQFNLFSSPIGQAYVNRRLRSLSTGDVLTFDDAASLAVAPIGWDRLDAPIKAGSAKAEQAERAYDIVPREDLARLAGSEIVDPTCLCSPGTFTDDQIGAAGDVFWAFTDEQRMVLSGFFIDRDGYLSEVEDDLFADE